MQNFRAETYVTAVENLLESFIEAKPTLALGKRIGKELAALGISADDPVIGRLAETMHDLFGTTR